MISGRSDLLFCILVSRTDHLREVDEHSLAGLSLDEDVELVEISVNEAGSCEAEDKGDEGYVEVRRGVDMVYLPPSCDSVKLQSELWVCMTNKGKESMRDITMQCRA